MTHPCSVCGELCTGPESRTLAIAGHELRIGDPGKQAFSALDDERARSCGQTHALVLTERYLERGTFAPAAFTLSVEYEVTDESRAILDAYASTL